MAFFRWSLDAKEKIDTRNKEEIERDDASFIQSTQAAKNLVAEQRGFLVKVVSVWVPLQDSIRLGALVRWYTNIEGERGTGAEAVFIDGLPFENPQAK